MPSMDAAPPLHDESTTSVAPRTTSLPTDDAAVPSRHHTLMRAIATLVIVVVLGRMGYDAVKPRGQQVAVSEATVVQFGDDHDIHHHKETAARQASNGTSSPTPETSTTKTTTSVPVSSGPVGADGSSVANPVETNIDWLFPRWRSGDDSRVTSLDGWAASPSPVRGPGITNDDDIARFGQPLGVVLPCAASAAGQSTPGGAYPIVFAPVGCFGDPLQGKKCDELKTTSCRLGEALAHVVARCTAGVKVGAFIGDNFYPFGLRKATEPRFEHELAEKFWRHSALQMPWLGAVGNHDRKPWTQLRIRVGSAEHVAIEKMERESGSAAPVAHAPVHKYFDMPAYHHVSEVYSHGDTTVQFFVVDTQWGFEANDQHMAAEAEWLDKVLRNSEAIWKVVMSHEPIWGFMNFPHGRGMAQHLHPVLVRHRVQFFVAAHQHSVSMHRCTGGYYQVISAGFADNLHDAVKPRRPAGYYHLGRGAVAMMFNASHAHVVAFTVAGRTIFSQAVSLAEVNAALAGGTRGASPRRIRLPPLATLLADGRVAATTKIAQFASQHSAGGTLDVPLALEVEGETKWGNGGGDVAGASHIWDHSISQCAAMLPAKDTSGCTKPA